MIHPNINNANTTHNAVSNQPTYQHNMQRFIFYTPSQTITHGVGISISFLFTYLVYYFNFTNDGYRWKET